MTPGFSSGIYLRLSRLLWARDRFSGTGVVLQTSPSSSPAQDTALSRRRHRFKSGRGRQKNQPFCISQKGFLFMPRWAWCETPLFPKLPLKQQQGQNALLSEQDPLNDHLPSTNFCSDLCAPPCSMTGQDTSGPRSRGC